MAIIIGNDTISTSGSTTPSLSLAAVPASLNGYFFRVIASNGFGATASNPVTATVITGTAPTITQQPQSQIEIASGPILFTFNVVANGTAPLSYQWYRSTDGGSTWNTTFAPGTTGQTTSTLTVDLGAFTEADLVYSGDKYKVSVVNQFGNVESNEVTSTISVGSWRIGFGSTSGEVPISDTTITELNSRQFYIDYDSYTARNVGPGYSLSANPAIVSFAPSTGVLNQVEAGNPYEWAGGGTLSADSVNANTPVVVSISFQGQVVRTWNITVADAGEIAAPPPPAPPPPVETPPPDPPGGCLVDCSPVMMADGSTKMIQELVVGDQLMSFAINNLPLNSDDPTVLNTWSSDVINGTASSATVIAIRRFITDEYISINQGLLRTTPDHMHLVKTNNVWSFKKAADVLVGDSMLDKDSNEFVITASERVSQEIAAYKMDIEDLDVYYANGVLTHNIKVIEDPL